MKADLILDSREKPEIAHSWAKHLLSPAPRWAGPTSSLRGSALDKCQQFSHSGQNDRPFLCMSAPDQEAASCHRALPLCFSVATAEAHGPEYKSGNLM